MITPWTLFEKICRHVEYDIIAERKNVQPYAVFEDKGQWFAAPLWWVQERGYRAEKIWRPKP